jgi:hypothetical protein
LARHIAEIGGGASPGTESNWPTPNVPCGEQTFTEGSMTPTGVGRDGTKKTVRLSERVGMWTTPCSDDTGTRTGRYKQGGTAPVWPSPRATDGEKGGPNQAGSKGDQMLPSAASTWATPSARDWRSGDASDDTMERNARPLNEQATHWPTPDAGNFGNQPNANTKQWGGHNTLASYSEHWGTFPSRPDPATEADGPATSKSTRTSRRQLNPRFVEALMGLPPGWTDFEGSATPSCRSKPRPPCASSGTAPSENCRD